LILKNNILLIIQILAENVCKGTISPDVNIKKLLKDVEIFSITGNYHF